MSLIVDDRSTAHWRIAAAAAVLSGAMLAAGCAQTAPKLSYSAGPSPMAASAPERPPIPAAEKAVAEKQAVRSAMLAKAEAEPKDVPRTIIAARTLKSEGRIPDALQLVERSLAINSKDPAIVREAGLLSLDAGQVAKAEKHLRKAIELGATEWQTRSAFGAALAAQGKHAEAQLQLAKALELKPDHPAILNNLALSYALDNKPAEAENVLRIAAGAKGAPKHVQHNLAMVLGIRGKTSEAERVATAASPTNRATANAAFVKSLAPKQLDTNVPVATAPSGAVPIKAARAPAEFEKPLLLGVGAPKDSP
ncbi:MAG: hypothetical protein ACKVP7_26000 [Hyphomicrobiaceae bacterium]